MRTLSITLADGREAVINARDAERYRAMGATVESEAPAPPEPPAEEPPAEEPPAEEPPAEEPPAEEPTVGDLVDAAAAEIMEEAAEMPGLYLEHTGGGYFEIRVGGGEVVEKIRGKKAAQERLKALEAESAA